MSYPHFDFSFDEYSKQAYSTAQYPNKGNNLVYPAIKLAGEAGETADKIGKHWRNKNDGKHGVGQAMDASSYSEEEKAELVKEISDVLWYVNALAIELGVTLEHVAKINLEKLAGRVSRGTIKSSGDNR
jgi:NTP pyrophosphatase (non-canonical NTP hydrolase)